MRKQVLLIAIVLALLGHVAPAQQPPFAFELVIENQFGKTKNYQRIWRMGTFLRIDPMKSPTQPASDVYDTFYAHLVPNGMWWLYSKRSMLGVPEAIVYSDLEWWAFWQEVKRKGLHRVIAENHITPEGQKVFRDDQFYAQAQLEKRMEWQLRFYNQFPNVPWFPTPAELRTFGKKIGEDRVGRVPCWVYEKREVARGQVTQTRLWVSKSDGMVWQRLIETWPQNSPNQKRLIMASRVYMCRIVKSLPESVFQLPPGTVAILPDKVQEYVSDRFGLGKGVRIQHQEGFGIIFNPVTAADFAKPH